MPSAKLTPPNPSRQQVVLVVEDNDVYRGVVVLALHQYLPGSEIIEAVSVKDALRVLGIRHVSVMIVDMTLPDGTAITLLENSQPLIRAGLKVIVSSNHSREDMLPILDRHDVHAYIEKAQGPRQLALAIQAAAESASPQPSSSSSA